MTSIKPARLPRDLDLLVIHEAFLEAGFPHVQDAGLDTLKWVYLKTGEDFGFIGLPNPNNGFVGDGLFETPEHQRAAAARALDILIGHTGGHHLHCGPRSDRERAFIDCINATNNFA